MPHTLAKSLGIDNYLQYFDYLFPRLNSKNFFTRIILLSLMRLNLLKHFLIMPYLELCITTKCTLHCKYCANFIPLYGKGNDLSLDEILTPFAKLIDAVDFISEFRILGGEPFVHPLLPEIIEGCMKKKKFDHIEIVTNGTIVPSDYLLNILKKYDVVVYISNYGNIVKNRRRLIDSLVKNEIRFLFEDLFYWENFGDGRKFDYSVTEVRKIYADCDMICKALFKGELHVCPRSSHGTDLGFIEKRCEDFVDIMSFSTRAALRAAIFDLYEKRNIAACYHCLAAPIKIKAGEQISFLGDNS